jgi:hypothetical protein
LQERTSAGGGEPLRAQEDFSFVLGGPLFQLLRRTHLTDDALLLVRQRVVVISLAAWLPLLVLSLMQGQALNGLGMPFLLDPEVHARFLLALPLLVIAELVVHQRMLPVARQFRERDLVSEQNLPRFEAALASAGRLRNSVLAEVLLIALVYGVGIMVVWRQYVALDAASWYVKVSVEGSRLSMAGWWYGFVSLPIFQFLLFRWYFRLFIWARFLWQVSRIELDLVPSHPDRVGGLGFLPASIGAFIPIAVAHGVLLSGQLADRIFYAGATLPSFKFELALVVVLLLAMVLGPLLVFVPQLARARRAGLREYGALAQRYVRGFEAKWLRGGASAGEPLVGSADIQSLADLGNSYEVVRSMKPVPITREAILQVALATLAPILPLLLTMMPLEELLKKLVGILL